MSTMATCTLHIYRIDLPDAPVAFYNDGFGLKRGPIKHIGSVICNIPGDEYTVRLTPYDKIISCRYTDGECTLILGTREVYG